MSDNGSFTEHDTSLNGSLFNTQSQLPTDSQFNDQDMYNLIKSSFGQLDRKSFKQELLTHTDVDDLRPIRNSLFDLIRKQEHAYSECKLVERAQRENGQPIEEKLADDIFIMFHYIEGANNVTELRQCISRSRRATTVADDNDAVLADIINKLSNKANHKSSENTIVLSMLMEIKQMITDTMKPISDNVEKLTNDFTSEITLLKNKLREKDNKIMSLQSEIQKHQMQITGLQSDIIDQSQHIKKMENELNCENYMQPMNKTIKTYDTKQQAMKENNKPSYSETLTKPISDKHHTSSTAPDSLPTGTDHEQQSIPVIASSNLQHKGNKYRNHGENSNVNMNNYIDYSYLNNNETDSYYENNGPYNESIAKDDDMSAFRGVVRKRTKRIVLYNVMANKPYETVDSAVRAHFKRKGVHVTFTKLLKRRENKNYSTFIMRVNVLESDFVRKIENNCDDDFWPEGVYWRDYVPYNNYQSNTQ